MQRQLLTAALFVLCSVNLVHAEGARPTLDRVWVPQTEAESLVSPAVDSNVIFMHRCSAANPCTVQQAGTNDSRTNPNHSNIVSGGTHTLSAFSQSDTTWTNTMACMRDTFEPFGVTITDVDPGSANHFEILVGGQPGQVGMGNGVGGVSPYNCNIINNTIVFVFDVWGNNSEDICSTAAQEVAHSWALDHSTDASDPMTYFGFSGRRHFKNANVNCGSDCEGGQGPFGDTCSGQNHNCACTGVATQNTFAMVKNIFGDGTPTPPVVAFTKPMPGEAVQPGFAVTSTVTDDSVIQKVDFFIDNMLIKSITTKPYAFNAPDTLGQGNHNLKIVATDAFGTPGEKTITVSIGAPCAKPSECDNNTDTCVGGRCVPGSGVQGGLGTSCTDGTGCASGQCAQGADGSFCVEPCVVDAGQCPGGFTCLDTSGGAGMGVCYPGDDGGGCSTGSRQGAMVGLGLMFAALVFGRRRRSIK